MDEDERNESISRLSRRNVLGRAVRLGGAIAWTVPLIQTVDIRAAAALAGSGGPGDEVENTNGGSSGGGGVGDAGSGGGIEGGSGGGGGATAPILQVLELRAVPNPFILSRTDGLQIGYLVSGAAVVNAVIMRGDRVVRRFSTRKLSAAGSVSTRWNGKNRRGQAVPPGRYFVLVEADDGVGNKAEARLRVRIRS